MRRENKEKEGWIYEVFYRINPNIEGPVELSAVRFKNGYIILTEIVDLYPDLTFQDSILKININQVRRIKYFEELEFHIISIRFQ